MSAPVITGTPDEPLVDAVKRMHDRRVGSIIVTNGHGPLGILTERDVLAAAVQSGGVNGRRVGDAMTAPADVVDADYDAASVLKMMGERGYRHMPVITGGELVGVVSLRDLARVASIGPADVPRGLKGVVVADTEIGDVRGSEGFYHYRQYSAVELAAQPAAGGRVAAAVRRRAAGHAQPSGARSRPRSVRCGMLPAELAAVLPAIARASRPLDGLRTALSLAGARARLQPVYRPRSRRPAGPTRCSSARGDPDDPGRALPTAHRPGAGRAPRRPRLRRQLPVDADRRRSPSPEHAEPSSST